MSKLKIKITFLGHLPHSIDIDRIKTWKSKLFEVIDPIDSLIISSNADLEDWEFSDRNISHLLPDDHDGDIFIAVTAVPLEENYYARRFSNNRICITFSEIGDYLKYENIPLENFILRVLYSASFVYKKYNKQIPATIEISDFTHDETRGCIFDMNGIKNDIIYSTNKPILCDTCVHKLTHARIESNLIESVKNELKNIEKSLYNRIIDLIKEYPICAIVLSSITAIVLGAIGSLVASYLWEIGIKRWFNF
jgi:hypothetical protein